MRATRAGGWVVPALTGGGVGLLCGGFVGDALSTLPRFGVGWSLATQGVLALIGAVAFAMPRARLALVIGAEGGRAEAGGDGVAKPDTPAPAGVGASTGEKRAGARAKALDTSALIDARIVGIAEAHFLEGALLLPAFVLAELQRLADGGDPLRRARGRRGLEVAERLARGWGAVVVPGEGGDVDAQLRAFCAERDADLVTTDANLARLAAAQGVRVLNPNALAQAVRPPHLPGEELLIAVIRAGRDPGQGLGYLEDGTMVVVEGGASMIGRQVGVVVTSSLQTQAGRMLFARPRRVDGIGAEP